jgi:anti-anti-sigma factor
MSDKMISIDQERRGGWLLLRLSGEIDLSNADGLRERIEFATVGDVSVIVDLAEVEYIDSQGLRLLTGLAGTLAARGAALRLVAPPAGFARGVLDLARIGDDIEIRDSIDLEV